MFKTAKQETDTKKNHTPSSPSRSRPVGRKEKMAAELDHSLTVDFHATSHEGKHHVHGIGGMAEGEGPIRPLLDDPKNRMCEG